MRKIMIILLILGSLGFYIAHISAFSKIKLRLDDQIGIAFLNKNMLLVLDDKKNATLLALDKGSITNLNKFYYRDLDVIMLRENLIDIKNVNEQVLYDEYEKEDVEYTYKNGLIYISYEGTNTCIFTGNNSNINDCQFIYFHNPNVSNIYFSDFNEVVLYYYKKPLNVKMLEHIYEQAIDLYPIRDDEITIIKLSRDDYDFIVIKDD